MNAQQLLERLHAEGPNGPLGRLTDLVVEEGLSLTLEEAFAPSAIARSVKQALEAWLVSDEALTTLERTVRELEASLKADGRTLREVLPEPLRTGGGKLAAKPYSPHEAVVRRLLEPEPVRELIRELTFEVLMDFGRKLRAPVTESRMAKGLTGLAKLAADQAKSRSGAFGALASGMVTAVSDEVERQLERRANEFVDATLSEIISRLAHEVSSPSRATRRAALASAVFEGAMQITLTQLGGELSRMDVPGRARVLREGLGRWLSEPEALTQLEQWVKALLGANAGRPLRELLEEVGLLPSASELGREALGARLSATVRSQAFEKWLEELLA